MHSCRFYCINDFINFFSPSCDDAFMCLCSVCMPFACDCIHVFECVCVCVCDGVRIHVCVCVCSGQHQQKTLYDDELMTCISRCQREVFTYLHMLIHTQHLPTTTHTHTHTHTHTYTHTHTCRWHVCLDKCSHVLGSLNISRPHPHPDPTWDLEILPAALIRAAHFRYFWIFSILENDFLHFFSSYFAWEWAF